MVIIDGLLWLLKNILIINILLAILLVFFERRNPSTTWAWLMILLFVPILGFFLYLFLGQDLRKKKVFAVKEEDDRLERMINQQEKVLSRKDIEISYPNIRKSKDLIYLHLVSHNALFTTDNSVEIFNEGNDKFDKMIEDIKNAKKFIHMEYYIIRNDWLGKRIIELLAVKQAKV